MISPLRPTPGRLDAILRGQQDAQLTYREVGATRGPLPPGYLHGNHEVALGRGDACFERAAEALRSWSVHRGGGVDVTPPDAPIQPGTVVVLTAHLAGLHLTFACRVVYAVDEPGRWGFAYGTLPRHLIEGEEAFVVERDDDGAVRFRITAFVRPHGGVLRLGAPFLDDVDQWFVRRYLRAMRRQVDGP